MTKSENKRLSCRQYIIQNCENFNKLKFYEYYNFVDRSDAESALKATLVSVEKPAKKNRNVQAIVGAYSKENYKVWNFF